VRRRTFATVVAVPLLLALWAAALLLPLPYVTYSPGPTVDILGSNKGEEYVTVEGRETYRDDGELRLTTVYVTYPDAQLTLVDVVRAWLSPERAVVPRESVYAEGETREDAELESAVQMVSSQDLAIAAAMVELGLDPKPVLQVLSVSKDEPADGKLKVRDVLVAINGSEVTTTQQVVDAVRSAAAGEKLSFEVLREGRSQTVEVTPKRVGGVPRIGIVPGLGFDFPFKVRVNIPDDIGGPSAGLMFSLAIYDTLTPGSLTDGRIVAGTGTIEDPSGRVGAIGGIPQKIVAAQKAKAEIFLVPPGNCAEALSAPREDMQLVSAPTMSEALETIQAWVEDPDMDLPLCEDAR
jgi:PDZ domain-containing protein